jgi:hypothetical protein
MTIRFRATDKQLPLHGADKERAPEKPEAVRKNKLTESEQNVNGDTRVTGRVKN